MARQSHPSVQQNIQLLPMEVLKECLHQETPGLALFKELWHAPLLA